MDLSLSGGDFMFAFNNVNFSDRLLRIEITRSSGAGEVSCSSIVDWARDRKRRREEDVTDTTHTNDATCHVESYLNKNSCETNNENINNKKHEEALVMAEQEPKSGGEDHEIERVTNNTSVLRVNELHISSAILAAKSPFFLKLFSNGMLESEQKQMTLKIDASEEAAVMELLNFMYSNSLSVTAPSALLDVLMAADKFEVASCMNYCSQLLLKMPMTLDSALLLLDLPSSLLMADSVKPLTNAARQFIASRYKNMSKITMEELMALPLVGIEAILASDGLEIQSEDVLYEVVLKWVKSNYSVLEERQEILGSHLARYIRFPHMTIGRLKHILSSNDFTPSMASKLVIEALFFKTESLAHQRLLLAHEQPASTSRRFAKRAYVYKPIKIVEFAAPRPQCIIYLDLKRKECESIYPSSRLSSQLFTLGGQGFFLSAQCNMDHLCIIHCFGLFIGMQENGSASATVTVDYEFSVRSKPTMEFVGKFKGNYTFTGGKAVGCRNLLAIPWDIFTAKNCPYFINDVLHLRADLFISL
ncbi:BTB/POZ domain [Arabidopsis thaliana x Arabidopsis arenosa]|uniref:BTB/POZ domain n=1 Tax=Arabidopsis thaliana x Arabidopsis arenosa TaxID=1240361 RepID=A0A8T1Z566_9BRAS|nr:BTB/POZ domain [Arabidopsis thaliana x Arabidopsis arenosa]